MAKIAKNKITPTCVTYFELDETSEVPYCTSEKIMIRLSPQFVSVTPKKETSALLCMQKPPLSGITSLDRVILSMQDEEH